MVDETVSNEIEELKKDTREIGKNSLNILSTTREVRDVSELQIKRYNSVTKVSLKLKGATYNLELKFSSLTLVTIGSVFSITLFDIERYFKVIEINTQEDSVLKVKVTMMEYNKLKLKELDISDLICLSLKLVTNDSILNKVRYSPHNEW